MKDDHASRLRRPAAAGVLAAELLRNACDSALESRDSLHVEVVRDSALDLRRQLDALADENHLGLVAEGALRCADLANLAACAVPELPEAEAPAATAAACRAAEAARALCSLTEEAAKGSDGDLAEYALRDAHSAAWRADLVTRQVEEASTERRAEGP